MKKKSGMLLVLMFSVFIGAFFVMNLIMPDRSFSSQENRALQQLPSFSLSSLFSGTYTSKF